MEEIINSVMQSPENTNPNVLRSQLQNISEGGNNPANAYTVNVDGNGNLLSGTFDEAKQCFQSGKRVFLALILPSFTIAYCLTDYAKNVDGVSSDATSFTEGTKEVFYMTIINESTGNRVIPYAFFSDNTLSIRVL